MLCYENKSVGQQMATPAFRAFLLELLLSCHALVYLEGAFWEGGATLCSLVQLCSRACDRNIKISL